MAGANYQGGVSVEVENVPTIGGTDGAPATAPVAASAHLGDANRAEGVNYNSDNSIGVNLDTDGYPAGTRMSDNTPTDNVN